MMASIGAPVFPFFIATPATFYVSGCMGARAPDSNTNARSGSTSGLLVIHLQPRSNSASTR
jgi:hypothetical protein